jgi:predicted phage terminase large subunit-like protein
MMFPENEVVQTREEVLEMALTNPVMVLTGGDRLSLYEFLRIFWNEAAGTAFLDNWHIEYLCGELEKVAWRVARNLPCEKDLVINIPPGTTKTIICSIMFPAWCWSMGWYWMQFITASYSEKLALESAEKSRDLIRSDKFKMIFPETTIKDDKDTKGNFRIGKAIKGKMRWGGNRFSTSVGGTLTGFHGHILIVDDPLNPEQAVSEKELETCNRWMEQTLPTRKVDKNVSAMVLIMQRLHQNDPTGRAIERKPESINHICLPGELSSYRKFLNPAELEKYYVNDLLDPVRLGKNALRKLEEDLGQYAYAGQIGQNPVPPGGGMFHVDEIVTVNSISNVGGEVIISTVRYWDKAGTQGGGAYTAGVKMSRLKNGKYLIEHVARGQWGTDAREKHIWQHTSLDGMFVKVGIEQEPGSGGKESAESTVRNLAGYSVTVDHPTGDKIFRADPFSVQVNYGNVIMLRGDWNRAFIDELRMFPFGTYKDQVDAASGAFQMLAKRKFVKVIR